MKYQCLSTNSEKHRRFWITLVLLLLAATHAMAETAGDVVVSCLNATVSRPVTLRDAVFTAMGNQPSLLIAEQEVEKARANLLNAMTPLLPSANLALQGEHSVPNYVTPATVIGSTVIGGQSATYTEYASVGVNWNLYNGGRDYAGYRGVQAEMRASEASLNNQMNDTLTTVLDAFNELSQAWLDNEQQQQALIRLKNIQARAIERFQHNSGTAIAVSQAKNLVHGVERQISQTCRTMADKSALLAQAMGIRLERGQIFRVKEQMPELTSSDDTAPNIDAILALDPAVIAARENVDVAEKKVSQAKATFRPTVALSGRRDFLGQDPNGFGAADRALSYNSYRVGIVLQQPLGPFTSESANLAAARAELAKANATYQQTLIDAETKLRSALNAKDDAQFAVTSAQQTLQESQEIMTLTESLYQAGRTDMDNVERTRIDKEKTERLVQEYTATFKLAQWKSDRALHPGEFADNLLKALGLPRNAL